MQKILLSFLVLTSIALSSTAQAAITVSTDQADFNLVAETFAHRFCCSSSQLTSNSGDITFKHFGFGYTDFSGLLPGNEFVMTADETFDLEFASGVTAFAMDYADTADVSVFNLGFFSGAVSVGTTSFTSDQFGVARFIGFVSDVEFDKVAVVEDDGVNNSDEFFQLYSATAVPAPGMVSLMALGMVGLMGRRRRG